MPLFGHENLLIRIVLIVSDNTVPGVDGVLGLLGLHCLMHPPDNAGHHLLIQIPGNVLREWCH